MNKQTARDLTQAVADVADIRIRLTALEHALEQQSPALYAAYQREFENLRSSKAHDMFLAALESLQRRLESE